MMKVLLNVNSLGRQKALYVCGLVFFSLFAGFQAFSEVKSASDTVRENTDLLTKRLLEIKPLYSQDKEKFYDEVEATLSPLIDFKGFSRGVMAKHYRGASDAQKNLFSAKFKQGLIRTYAEAVVEFDNQKIEILLDKSGKNPGRAKNPKKTTVKLVFHGKNGSLYPVDYKMVLSKKGWLLRNVVINGINVGLQFKSQFSSSMQTYRNDIDKVIENWDTKVETSKSG